MKKNESKERNAQAVSGRQALGRLGETLAAGLLEQAGYEILARNYRCRCGEIDLIAEKDGILTFVEVKTRRNDRFGAPAEAVTREKQKKIRLAAASYLNEIAGDGCGTGGDPQMSTRRYRGMEFQVVEILIRQLTGLVFQEVGSC